MAKLHPTLNLPEGTVVKVSEDSETYCSGHVGFLVRQELANLEEHENEWGFASFNSTKGVCYEIPYEDFEVLQYFDNRFYRVRVPAGEYINNVE